MKTRSTEKPSPGKQGRKKPNQLHIRTKLEIIARLKAGETATLISKECKINEATVRYIRKNLNLIMRKGEALGLSLPEVPVNKPPDPCQVKMEQLLKEWIELHKVSLAHRELIREKAQVFYRLIRKENNMEDKECEVVNSGHWFKTFKNRFLRDKMKEVNSVSKTVMGSTSSENKTDPKKVSTLKSKLKSKPKRIFLTFNDKLDIVHKLDEGQEALDLARSYNVCLTTIRRVGRRANEFRKQAKRTEKVNSPKATRKQEKETSSKVQTTPVLQQKDKSTSAQKTPKIVNKQQNNEKTPTQRDTELNESEPLYDECVDKMEELLKSWMKKHRVSLVATDVILRKAGTLYDLIRNENKLEAGEFEPCEKWLRRFKEQFEETESDVDMEISSLECDKTNEHNQSRKHEKVSTYQELEELFNENLEEHDVRNGSTGYLKYGISPQERLQTNNKPQPSPSTTPNSHTRQESRVLTPQNNDTERDPDEVCLRWNSHHSNMKTSFPTLLEKEQYVDVTLCSEGQTIRCHRLILSSCSSYFDEILSGITPLQHPVIFLKGTPFWILKSLIDFMYVGEVHIEQAKLQEILEVAELLKIKGLTGKSTKGTAPKDDTPIKKEKLSVPMTQPPRPQSSQPTTPSVARSATPLKFVTKEQAANMQIVDPLSLLKPTYYEESGGSKKQLPLQIRPKPQSLAEFSAKQKEWLSKKITPKKKLKRKSTDHEPSPPPVILRKGTKSRPIVKAPKYYHMEYEQKKDNLQGKGDEDTDDSDSKSPQRLKTPMLIVPGVSAAVTSAQLSEPTYDLANVKSEPVEMDIEESYMDYEDNEPSTPNTSTPLIRVTEPRTVSADESNIFVSNPNSPEPLVTDNEKDPEEKENEEENQMQEEVNENDNDAESSNVNEDIVESNEDIVESNEVKGFKDNEEKETVKKKEPAKEKESLKEKSPTIEPDPEPESLEKEPGEIDVKKDKSDAEEDKKAG